MANYGRFNWLPIWDKKLADWLAPLSPISSLMLIVLALAILYAAWKWQKHPELQLLLLAFLISP